MKTAIISVLLVVAASGCGGGGDDLASKPTPQNSSEAAPPSTTPTAEAPEARLLKRKALKEAIVGLSDLPPGFTMDAEATESNKYFCDYKPPYEEKLRATGSFSNDADGQYVSPVLRQFESADQASASFAALVKVIGRCKTDEVDGSTLHYSEMSAPRLGDGSVGVQMKVDGYTDMQNFFLSGPVIVSTGGVGVTATQVANILERQVDKYTAVSR